MCAIAHCNDLSSFVRPQSVVSACGAEYRRTAAIDPGRTGISLFSLNFWSILPIRRAYFSIKYLTSNGMSSRRSRNGGSLNLVFWLGIGPLWWSWLDYGEFSTLLELPEAPFLKSRFGDQWVNV